MALKQVRANVNGVWYTATLNSSTGKYDVVATAPNKSSYTQEGHFYPITVEATDQAGNVSTVGADDTTLGSSLQLKVKEKVAPVITITAPTASQLLTNNKPTIKWKVTDEDSGVNPDTIGLVIDSGSKITTGITKTEINGGYQCSYTPMAALADGSHTIKFNASDNDGNVAATKSVTFKVDTVPPTLSITSPSDGLVTNKSACMVSGITNDETSSPVTVIIQLNGGTAISVQVDSAGKFSKELTLMEGSNTITITAKDSAGKTTTITRNVTLDTVAPVIKAVAINPNPVDCGKSCIISIEVFD